MTSLKFKNGDKLPLIGLGTWKSKPGEVKKAVYEAIKSGYRHIDCAPAYGNEGEVGEGIKDAIDKGLVKRDDLWITSKLWNDSHKKQDVIPALQNTLNDLQLEYLDLFLIHWPVALKKGITFPEKPEDFYSLKEVPLTETWQGMENTVDQNLARHIGVSNFNENRLARLLEGSRIPPEMNQIEMHPFLRQEDLLNFCREQGVHVTSYAPLGSGDRSEKMKKDDEPVLMENEIIVDVAEKHRCSPAQILISWAIHRNTAVIPKSVNPERIQQNFEATTIVLRQDDMERINSLGYQYRFIDGGIWEMEGNSYQADKFWS